MIVESRSLLTENVLIDEIECDVILGMDWLAQHYASLDFHEEVAIFQDSQG